MQHRLVCLPTLNRRRLLSTLGGLGATLLLPRSGCVLAQPLFQHYPFQLGVASGDPSPDGFVLWTRLAPAPLDIGCGMPGAAVSVEWEVASDAAMRRIIAKGTAYALPELGHSVHVEVGGLLPDRVYYYRFVAGGERSLTGRTRTTPAPGAKVERVRFAVAGCQHYEQGWYTAHRRLADELPDFVYCYGDYIYEGRGNRIWNSPHGPVENVRQHFGNEIYSLDDYRRRYAQYKMDADLQAAHAAAPWWVVWDDHEIDNNWVSDTDQDGTDPAIFRLRRQAAMQAYYEHMPLRLSSLPQGSTMSIYRRAAYGQLLDLHLLDTRQFRSDQPCGDRYSTDCAQVNDRHAQVLGTAQEQWLNEGLTRSKATWNVLAQQVMLMDLDRSAGIPTPSGQGPGYNVDSWGGYRVPRERLLRTLKDHKILNAVVLTGDEHQHYAGDLYLDGAHPEGSPLASEFVVTSISSGGDGEDQSPEMARVQAANPMLKFNNSQRGYAICEASSTSFITEFKVLEAVTRRDARLSTRARWALETGRSGLQQA